MTIKIQVFFGQQTFIVLQSKCSCKFLNVHLCA